MRVYNSISELVGGTPLLRLNRYAAQHQLQATLLVKLESLNPAGSVKDRIAMAMVDQAEKDGSLQPGGVIIEPTSGNTGIGLAAIAASRGYRCLLVMTDTMSMERRQLLKAYGAELILVEGAKGMPGAIEKARELHLKTANSVVLGQFSNPANPWIHRETTGPEIWRDTDGQVDILVSGVGTGGTITGAGTYLKQQNPAIRVVAVEPSDSPVLSGGEPGPHKIQGIGAGFVPQVLDTGIYDEIITISNEDAIATGAALAHMEGLLVGVSSGAAVAAAAQLALQPDKRDKTIVVVLPDSGDRYLSGPMFQ